MRYYCYCGRVAFLEQTSAMLISSWFAKLLDKKALLVLCDECGRQILNNYKNTYGIGV